MQNKILSSPLYNLSMCSFENFHTCFINWLGKTYPNETLKLFVDNPNYTNIDFNNQEKLNNNIFDLYATMRLNGEKEILVVENKIKSFPTAEQLKKYKDSLADKNAHLVLLSLVPMNELPQDWNLMTYFELAKKMKTIFTDETVKDNYNRFLIDDYINVIEHISNKFPKETCHKYDFYEKNDLEELQDIYIKYRTSEFANLIEQNINTEGFHVSNSFHNKKGTIDIVKEFEDYDFVAGIQIEGNQYRYYFRTLLNDSRFESKVKREKIAEKLYVNGYWFNDTKNPTNPKLYDNFCGYEPDFIYRYQTLENMLDVEELADIDYEKIIERINQDICNFEDNKYRIIDLIVKNS